MCKWKNPPVTIKIGSSGRLPLVEGGSTLRIGQHDPESQVFFTVNRNGTHRVRDNPHRRRSQYPQQTTFPSDYSAESFQIYWCVVVERQPECSWNRVGQIYYTCCSFTTTFSVVASILDCKSWLRYRYKSKQVHFFGTKLCLCHGLKSKDILTMCYNLKDSMWLFSLSPSHTHTLHYHSSSILTSDVTDVFQLLIQFCADCE